MSDFSLSSQPKIEVNIRIIAKGSDAPLTGDMYKVRLFDKDSFDDDYLGESGLDTNGVAHISFTHDAFDDLAGIEDRPDFYFVVVKNDVQIFQSKVMEEIDLEAVEQFKMGRGEVIDLGTFLVEA
jgi:hypothetical protein